MLPTLLTTDPDGADSTDITYDGLGRVHTRSNPHRSGSLPTDGTTTYVYDALGRTTIVNEPDGSAAHTSYTGNCSMASDEANTSRTSCSDALGRLTAVIEDPAQANYETDYEYDTLDNLKTATQKGGDSNSSNWRTRSFLYDSLSRLVSATNPESGTISYLYDLNGNLASRVAPDPNLASGWVTTNYSYDALNRLTLKSYTGIGTAPVQFGYENVALMWCTTPPPAPNPADAYPIGRRTSMCDGSGATAWAHDKMGRVLQDKRTLVGSINVTKAFNYTYNLNGSLATLQYPSGRTITYGLKYSGGSTSGLLLSAKDLANGINYVTSASYAPQGALGFMLMSGTIKGAMSYNSRLQPLQIAYGTNNLPSLNGSSCPTGFGNIMHRVYHFGLGVADNGNVQSIDNCRDTTRTAVYTYDSLNRITNGHSTGSWWGDSYTIDPWGNLTNMNPGLGKTYSQNLQAAPANSKNQLNISGQVISAAGNMTNDGSGHIYPYDAENRLVSTGGWTYVYDADGRRVRKCSACSSAAGGTLYWPGTGGDSLIETDLAGGLNFEYIFFNGKRTARRTGTSVHPNYYLADHLGSTSVVTDDAGNVLNESDYFPYGGEIVITTSVAQNYKFTGKERDAESGLDNFGARYVWSNLGRFMAPDPVGGKLVSPQTLNKYSYVANNPINFTDPTGLYVCADDPKGAREHCTSDKDKAFEEQRKEALKSDNLDTVRGASAYGDPGKDNGVTVAFGDPGDGNSGLTTHDIDTDLSQSNGLHAKETVTIRDTLTGTDLKDALSHEGSHVADAQAFVNGITPSSADYTKNLTKYQTELRAYMVTQSVLSSANEKHTFGCGLMGTCELGAGVTDVTGNINRLLNYKYHVTPQNQGPRLYPLFVAPPPAATVPR